LKTRADRSGIAASGHLTRLTGALVLFALLTWAVANGYADAFDRYLLAQFQHSLGSITDPGHATRHALVFAVTDIGGLIALFSASILACTLLYLRGRKFEAIMIAVVALSAQASIEIIKTLLNRGRPPGSDVFAVHERGFPSGHAGETTAVFMTIALAVSALEIRREAKIFIVAVAATVSVFVGLTRLYLNVHWPVDVAAGWMLGAGWAFLAAYLIERNALFQDQTAYGNTV